MSNENKDVNTVEDEVVEAGVKILHKRGKGRPAPGELETGEIGINTSTVKDDVETHGLWESFIVEPARAFTADDEGRIHAIGDWESLAPSPVYGDVPYQTSYTQAADARVRPGSQQAIMAYKNYVAYENEFDKPYFPIPVGGDAADIDSEKYLHNFASIKFSFKHGTYAGTELSPINPPFARLIAGSLMASDNLDRTVTFEIDCLSLKVETAERFASHHNVPFFVDTHKDGKDLSTDQSGKYPTAQTFINAPMNLGDAVWGGEGSHWQVHSDYLEKPDAALCVYGDSAVLGGTIKATSSRVPTDPEEGMIYFNTNIKKFFGFDGTEWVDLAGGGTAASGDVDGGEFKTVQDVYDEQ